jgi:hypothetical protein
MKYTLALALALTAGCATAFAQPDNLTAQAILQRAIDSAGGDRLLDSVNSMDMIQQVVTPRGDTVYFASKQAGANKYLLNIMSETDRNTLTIYNDGRAVNISNGVTTSITDPLQLEGLRVDAFLSMDYAYKKMGYKLSRGDDQHYENMECYTVFAESPLGEKTINYYDKKTGHLLMIAYENLYKNVYLDYYKQRGVSIPSRMLRVDPKNNIAASAFVRIDDDPVIDTGWFHIPVEGLYKAPASFKTGDFNCLRENKTFSMIRDKDQQREIYKGVETHYMIDWTGNNDYTLIKDAEYRKCRILNWVGDKCYCQCIGSGGAEATVVLQKTQ